MSKTKEWSIINCMKINNSPSSNTPSACSGVVYCLVCQSVCQVLKDKPDQFVGPLGLLWLAQMVLTDASIRKEMHDAVEMYKSCGMCWTACQSETNFLEDAIKGLLSEEKLG
jgi:succinate dehydrogenase/fumarate reductase-like Fe-S protein